MSAATPTAGYHSTEEQAHVIFNIPFEEGVPAASFIPGKGKIQQHSLIEWALPESNTLKTILSQEFPGLKRMVVCFELRDVLRADNIVSEVRYAVKTLLPLLDTLEFKFSTNLDSHPQRDPLLQQGYQHEAASKVIGVVWTEAAAVGRSAVASEDSTDYVLFRDSQGPLQM
jgi:hypothetical protein